MGLPWVRLESNIASHDKMLDLIGRPGGHRAAAVYMFSLAYAGGHETDGRIPKAALPTFHGRQTDARLLVDVGLWKYAEDGSGWLIHNYAIRQELAVVTEAKRAAQRIAGRRTSCIRWHGKDCGCWQVDSEAPPVPQLRLHR